MRKLLIATIASLGILGAGAFQNEARAGDGQIFGVLLGAAAGGFVGSQFGSGDGQLAATAAGTLLGAGLGHHLTRDSHYSQPSYARGHTVHYVPPRKVHRPRVHVDRRTYVDQRTYVDRRTHVTHTHTVTHTQTHTRVVRKNRGHWKRDRRHWDDPRPYWARY